MKRPGIVVWAVDRIAREERSTVEQLIAASERMRAAQLGRLRDTAALAPAATAHRAALGQLLARARAALGAAGVAATHRLLLRMENTLTAAAADPELQPALRDGRLDRELNASGFEVFHGAMPPRRASQPAPVPAREPAHVTPRRGHPDTGERERRQARSDARARERQRAIERQRALEARRQAADERRRAAAERQRARLEEARAALTRAEHSRSEQSGRAAAAERRVKELREGLRDAEAALAHARSEAGRAASAARAAARALRAAERAVTSGPRPEPRSALRSALRS